MVLTLVSGGYFKPVAIHDSEAACLEAALKVIAEGRRTHVQYAAVCVPSDQTPI